MKIHSYATIFWTFYSSSLFFFKSCPPQFRNQVGFHCYFYSAFRLVQVVFVLYHSSHMVFYCCMILFLYLLALFHIIYKTKHNNSIHMACWYDMVHLDRTHRLYTPVKQTRMVRVRSTEAAIARNNKYHIWIQLSSFSLCHCSFFFSLLLQRLLPCNIIYNWLEEESTVIAIGISEANLLAKIGWLIMLL